MTKPDKQTSTPKTFKQLIKNIRASYAHVQKEAQRKKART